MNITVVLCKTHFAFDVLRGIYIYIIDQAKEDTNNIKLNSNEYIASLLDEPFGLGSKQSFLLTHYNMGTQHACYALHVYGNS